MVIGTRILSLIVIGVGVNTSITTNKAAPHKPHTHPTKGTAMRKLARKPAIVPSQDFFGLTGILCLPMRMPIEAAIESPKVNNANAPRRSEGGRKREAKRNPVEKWT